MLPGIALTHLLHKPFSFLSAASPVRLTSTHSCVHYLFFQRYVSAYYVPSTDIGSRGRKRHSPSSKGRPVFWGLESGSIGSTVCGDKHVL